MKPSEIAKELDRLSQLIRKRPGMAIVTGLVLVIGLGAALILASPFLQRLITAKLTAEPNLVITAPNHGAVVEEAAFIRGQGGTQSRFYYPVVIPLPSGSMFVAGPQITVNKDGSWEGHARFGDRSTPTGTRFRLYVIGSDTALTNEGALRDTGTHTTHERSQGVEVERR